MRIILLSSFWIVFFLTVYITIIRLISSEELRCWILEEEEDREELPKMTFKQIKPFVLLGKVEECQKINSDCYYRTIFLCNGKNFTFTNLFELKKYNDFQKIIEKEKTSIKQRKNQSEFLKHLQETVNAEYDEIAKEIAKENEFADRLGNYKEYRYNENCDFVPYVRLSDIEKVVYEMVGAESEMKQND